MKAARSLRSRGGSFGFAQDRLRPPYTIKLTGAPSRRFLSWGFGFFVAVLGGVLDGGINLAA